MAYSLPRRAVSLFNSPTTFKQLRPNNNLQPLQPSIRSFHASSANMTIKCYFDCSWEGPEVQVDSKGNVTSQGAVKRTWGRFFSAVHLVISLPEHQCSSLIRKHSVSVADSLLPQSNPAASTSTSTMTLFPRPLRTSVLSALARKASATLAPSSTVSFPSSCFRVVTSPAAT